MRRLGLQSMTRTLSYTAKYNSSLIVTGLVQIFDTISNRAAAAEWAFGFSRPQQNDEAPSFVAQVQVFGL
jgi:hypothetical protein